MEEITNKQIETELQRLNADEATAELIYNNVSLYNDLVKAYNKGETKNLYLTYQLNVQIFKQLSELKKLNRKLSSTEDTDEFSVLLNNLKPKIESR